MKKTPELCKSCKYFYTGGTGKYKQWCTQYSDTVYNKISHCKLKNGYMKKVKDNES